MFLTKPVPFDEASDAIAGLAPVDRETFANLIPELRDAAITIAGVEGLEVVTRVRDLISQLPLGGDFEELKAKIEEELSPWLTEKGAAKRATLLLRLHGFRAYAAAGYRQMEAHKDAFPYRQYICSLMETSRDSHRALHGIVLPADHPFWKNHTGPWDWNCHCEAEKLTQGAMERIREADQDRHPDKRLVLEGPALKRLDEGELVRGMNEVFDIRTPRERTGDPNAFGWEAGTVDLPLDQIERRYPREDWKLFRAWAKSVGMEGGKSLWDRVTTRIKKPRTFTDALDDLKVSAGEMAQIIKENTEKAGSAKVEQAIARWSDDYYQYQEAKHRGTLPPEAKEPEPGPLIPAETAARIRKEFDRAQGA